MVRRSRESRWNRARSVRVLGGACTFALAATVQAGTWRDDVADADLQTLALTTPYAATGAVRLTVGSTGVLGSGTLIAPGWVLTAGHMINSFSSDLSYNANQYTDLRFALGAQPAQPSGTLADNWFSHPSWVSSGGSLNLGWDIALVHLSTPITNVTPAAPYARTDERTQIGIEQGVVGRSPQSIKGLVTYVGYGMSGTGSTGATGAPGIKRAGDNVIDSFGGPNVVTGTGDLLSLAPYTSNIMFSDLDNPLDPTVSSMGTTSPVPREYIIAPGDSGGGGYISPNGHTFLAGVNSFIPTNQLDGTANFSYGDYVGSTRVSAFASWIDDNISHSYIGGASASFGVGTTWQGYTVANGGAAAAAVPGTYDTAMFNAGITSQINFNSSVTNFRLLVRSGSVTLNLASNTYTLNSTNDEGGLVVGKYSGESPSLTIQGGTVACSNVVVGNLPGSTGTLNITAANGRLQASGDVFIGGDVVGKGGTGVMNVQNSAVAAVAGTVHIYTGSSVNVAAGGALSAAAIRGATLSVSGTATVNANGTSTGTSVLSSLTLAGSTGAWTGRLELNDNDLIVNYSGTSPLQTLIDQVKYGQTHAAGISSATSTGHTILALVDNANLQLTTFSGQTLDGTTHQVLGKYTYYGDANLDGEVTSADYTYIDSHFGQSGPGIGWMQGDFNGDGAVTSADYTYIDTNFGMGVGNPLSAMDPTLQTQMIALHTAEFGSSYTTALTALLALENVPEPGSLSLLGFAAAGLLLRRRKMIL